MHRVVGNVEGTKEARYSMAYFCHPVDMVALEGVPSEVVQENAKQGVVESERRKIGLDKGEGEAARGEVLTAKQHLDRRLQVTYGLKE